LPVRLTLLRHGATVSMRQAGFPAPDEALDTAGAMKAAAWRPDGGRPDQVLASPARAAMETARRIGLEAAQEPALADMDAGAWAGHSLEDLNATAPAALAAWVRNPAAGAPDGESFADVTRRVGDWMDGLRDRDQRVLAITHAMVLRAAIAHALGLPAEGALRIDIAPLAAATLSFNGVWRLQALTPP
jgi:broad specificity phosphatase PhoE